MGILDLRSGRVVLQNPLGTSGSAWLLPTHRIYFLRVFADGKKTSGSASIDATRLILQSAVSFQSRWGAKNKRVRSACFLHPSGKTPPTAPLLYIQSPAKNSALQLCPQSFFFCIMNRVHSVDFKFGFT